MNRIRVFNSAPNYQTSTDIFTFKKLPKKPYWKKDWEFIYDFPEIKLKLKQQLYYMWCTYVLKYCKNILGISECEYVSGYNLKETEIDVSEIQNYVYNRLTEMKYNMNRFTHDKYMIITGHKLMRNFESYQFKTMVSFNYKTNSLFNDTRMICDIPVVVSTEMPEDMLLVLPDITESATHDILLHDRMELNRNSMQHRRVDINELQEKLGIRIV